MPPPITGTQDGAGIAKPSAQWSVDSLLKRDHNQGRRGIACDLDILMTNDPGWSSFRERHGSDRMRRRLRSPQLIAGPVEYGHEVFEVLVQTLGELPDRTLDGWLRITDFFLLSSRGRLMPKRLPR
jgi:hypothetical protein